MEDLTDKIGILVVDQDPGVLAVMTRTLENAGYVVMTAASSEEALHLWVQFAPFLRLVVTDIGKGFRAIPLVTRLLEYDVATPILVVGSLLFEQVIENTFPSPRVVYLAKPFNPAALLTSVRQLVIPSETHPLKIC